MCTVALYGLKFVICTIGYIFHATYIKMHTYIDMYAYNTHMYILTDTSKGPSTPQKKNFPVGDTFSPVEKLEWLNVEGSVITYV